MINIVHFVTAASVVCQITLRTDSSVGPQLIAFRSRITALSLPSNILQTVVDHMHNDTRVCGHTLFIESGKPQTIKTGDENVFQPLISQFCQHAQPEPRLFVLLYPHYQQHLVAFGIDYEH